MNWKEFLRPDLIKVIIIIILALLTYFFGIIEYYPWELMVVGGVTLKTNVFLLPLGFGLECSRPVIPNPPPWQCSNNIVFEGDWYHKPGFMFFLENYPLQISLNIIYWYLLSCLIFWIYDKVRKR